VRLVSPATARSSRSGTAAAVLLPGPPAACLRSAPPRRSSGRAGGTVRRGRRGPPPPSRPSLPSRDGRGRRHPRPLRRSRGTELSGGLRGPAGRSRRSGRARHRARPGVARGRRQPASPHPPPPNGAFRTPESEPFRSWLTADNAYYVKLDSQTEAPGGGRRLARRTPALLECAGHVRGGPSRDRRCAGSPGRCTGNAGAGRRAVVGRFAYLPAALRCVGLVG